MYKEFNQLPEGILDLQSDQLYEFLEAPALIHLNGLKEETLFVSVLLHGNEPVGWDAIRQVLKRYVPGGGNRELPRNLSIFIGNVKAAAQGMRRLDGQVDYNRVWPGGSADCQESEMMANVVKTMTGKKLFASLDIHNNTGINPHYGCINKVDNRFLRLAHLFRRLVIYFTQPTGVQSLAFSNYCPAVTIEAGKAGAKKGVEHAVEYIDECLHLFELSDKALVHEEVDLFHTVATVKIPDNIQFNFDQGSNAQLNFHNELEHYNFSELNAGTVWAEYEGTEMPLSVFSENGEEVFDKYFTVSNGKVSNRKNVMPAMLTTNHKVIEQDCLCYLMERYNIR